jgi:3-dehydroquinate synthase
LSDNLWEDRLDRCVDFGHSFSPAFEMFDGCSALHGEAVAFDIALCLFLAERRGSMGLEQCKRALSLLASCNLLDRRIDLNPQTLTEALADATVHRDGTQRLPLPVGIGNHMFVNDISPSEVSAAAARLGAFLEQMASRPPLQVGTST